MLYNNNSADRSMFSNSASFSFVLLVNVNSKQNLATSASLHKSWHKPQIIMGTALHASFCQLETHKACAFQVYDGVTPVKMPAHCFPAPVGTLLLLHFEDPVSVASNQQSLLAAPSCLLDIEPAASSICIISDQ